MRVKCLAQEQHTMSPARARTARSRDERTNNEATAPPYSLGILSFFRVLFFISFHKAFFSSSPILLLFSVP